MPIKTPKLVASLLIGFLATALIVTPIVLWAVTTPKGTVKTSCSKDEDCGSAGHGVCVNGACKCNSPWGGPYCDVLGNLKDASLTAGQGVACSQIPTPCKTTNDCVATCSQDVQYSCQTVTASQNSKGLAGSFCLPTQPADACLTGVSTTDSIPGFYTWQGWADVETMAWTCDCEFPNFYPYSTVSSGSGTSTTACALSDQVCQYGNWSYPCIRDPKNPLVCLNPSCTPGEACSDPTQTCSPITPNSDKFVCQLPQETCSTVSDCPGCGTADYPPFDPVKCKADPKNGCGGYTPDQITALCGTACKSGTCQKTCKLLLDCGSYPCEGGVCVTNPGSLLGANPFEYGLCDCSNQSCSTDADCAGTCLKGFCVGQRVALGPNGVPTCVKDTCAPGGTFTTLDIPPYTYGYCECSTGYSAQGNTCVYTAGEPPSTYCAQGCGHGSCAAPGKCACDAGWKGNSICTKFSCDMQSGCVYGTCVGPNICACDPGYTTDDKTGACTVINCPQGCVHGTCVQNGQGQPVCQCNVGYEGTNCNTPVSVTCGVTLTHESSSETQGACVSNNGTCTYGAPDTCTNNNAFFGNNNSFNNSNQCNYSCTQGSATPQIAGLPSLLCSDGKTTAACLSNNAICNNPPIELNTCMQNDLYAYSCTDLCSAFTALKDYDYNTICKKQTPPVKPSFCS